MTQDKVSVNDFRVATSGVSLESHTYRLRGERALTERLPSVVEVDTVGGDRVFRLNRFVWNALKEGVEAVFDALQDGPDEEK